MSDSNLKDTNDRILFPFTGLSNVRISTAEEGWHITTESRDPGRECNHQLVKDERYRTYQFMQALHDKLEQMHVPIKRIDSHRTGEPVVLAVLSSPEEKPLRLDSITKAIEDIIAYHMETGHFRDQRSRAHSRKPSEGMARG